MRSTSVLVRVRICKNVLKFQNFLHRNFCEAMQFCVSWLRKNKHGTSYETGRKEPEKSTSIEAEWQRHQIKSKVWAILHATSRRDSKHHGSLNWTQPAEQIDVSLSGLKRGVAHLLSGSGGRVMPVHRAALPYWMRSAP